jgi:hypothetical protein
VRANELAIELGRKNYLQWLIGMEQYLIIKRLIHTCNMRWFMKLPPILYIVFLLLCLAGETTCNSNSIVFNLIGILLFHQRICFSVLHLLKNHCLILPHNLKTHCEISSSLRHFMFLEAVSFRGVLWCKLVSMGSHFHPIKFASHPLTLHCHMPTRGAHLSPYQGQALHIPYIQPTRVLHCATSGQQLLPVHGPVIHKYTMFVTESFVQPDHLSSEHLHGVSNCQLVHTHLPDCCLSPVLLQDTTDLQANVSEAMNQSSCDCNKSSCVQR